MFDNTPEVKGIANQGDNTLLHFYQNDFQNILTLAFEFEHVDHFTRNDSVFRQCTDLVLQATQDVCSCHSVFGSSNRYTQDFFV
ncbi:hypothetical protein D3C80_1412710 [compost metagenome]